MKSNNLKICFACANIFREDNVDLLECPFCGNRVSKNKYEMILNDAREAVHYGWNYRRMYEKELEEKGRIDTHYYLAQYEEIFNFIAVAVLSGILGGVAYDIVKKVIIKISEFVKGNGSKEEKSKIFSLIDSEEDMNKFIQYIDEYYRSFENIDEEVRDAIFEEMIVDKMSTTLENIITQNADINMDEIKEISPFSEEEIFKSMIEVRRKTDMRERNKNTMFSDFWENIDKE